MSLTTEQLLQPRYRVIADYPDSRFKVGDIIAFTKEKPYTPLTKSSSHQVYYEEEVKKYPHLFQLAHWSEGRTKDEFPEYIVFSPRFKPQEIHKVTHMNLDEQGHVKEILCEREAAYYSPDIYDRPATKEEYEQYKSK